MDRSGVYRGAMSTNSDDEHRGTSSDDGNADDEPGTGKVAGMPYDWRKPTVARVKSRWWNPNDHRVFTPKAFGWGYDVNLYEVGRRMKLIRR